MNDKDTIYRKAAIDAVMDEFKRIPTNAVRAKTRIEALPPAQPEQRCINCGRTVNNSGWYDDGGTRCPIEEHYALPKDGYCHLWEKKKVWEDDYVKRPEGGKGYGEQEDEG